MDIPLMDPRAQYEPHLHELTSRIDEIVRSGQFIFGPHVEAFEQEAAAAIGVRHAVGVANGTDALVIALRSLGIGEGDEVICPAYTFYATGESVAAAGATPVFADIDPQTYNLDVDSVRSRITGRTKAIMPVHLFGLCADMDELTALAQDRGLALVEDSAQAWGATYQGKRAGSFGDVATFSFFPTKNLPCFGDGGLLVTDRDDVADMARKLRFHGSKDKKVFTHVGYNSRLDAIQAGILRILMQHVDGWNESRRRVAARYEAAGLGDLVTVPHVPAGREHVYHLYMVRTAHRAAIVDACREAGVATGTYYDPPSHLQPVFRHLGWGPGDLPESDAMGREGLALPMFPTMTDEQVDAVVATVRSAVPVGAAS